METEYVEPAFCYYCGQILRDPDRDCCDDCESLLSTAAADGHSLSGRTLQATRRLYDYALSVVSTETPMTPRWSAAMAYLRRRNGGRR